MTGELEAKLRDMFRAYDANDFQRALTMLADDVQQVDEISRRWIRDRPGIEAYLDQIAGSVEDIRSDLGDVHEEVWGDVGLVTCWLEQDYVLQGQRQHISAPTTAVLRRENGEWKFTLFHSVPLPAE